MASAASASGSRRGFVASGDDLALAAAGRVPVSTLLEKVRDSLLQRFGLSGTRPLAKNFLAFSDLDGKEGLSRKELDDCLQSSGVFLTKQEIGYLFREMNHSTEGGRAAVEDSTISWIEFMRSLGGAHSDRRKAMVEKVFHEIASDAGTETPPLSAVLKKADLSRHPDVLDGRKNERQAMEGLVDILVTAASETGSGDDDDASGSDDPPISWDAFSAAMADLSCAVASDEIFVGQFLVGTFGVAEKEAKDVLEERIEGFHGLLRAKVRQRTHGSDSDPTALARILRRFDRRADGLMEVCEFKEAMDHLVLEPSEHVLQAIYQLHGVGPGGMALPLREYAAAVFADDDAKTGMTSML